VKCKWEVHGRGFQRRGLHVACPSSAAKKLESGEQALGCEWSDMNEVKVGEITAATPGK
jgi:hypothetical protein